MKTIYRFMKNHFKVIAILLIISVSLFAFKSFNSNEITQNTSDKEKVILEILQHIVERGHYDPKAIDDNFSKNVYKSFIESLDPTKRYFLQSDIEKFKRYELEIDDQFKNRDLTFFNLVYDVFTKRLVESESFMKVFENKAFSFKEDESIESDFEKVKFASSNREMQEVWRKIIKYSVLNNLSIKMDEEEAKKEKDASYVIKSFAVLEKEARESVIKNFNENLSFYKNEIDKVDYFGIYVNELTSQFDPHTNYMAPNDKEKFDESISGKFEGIGARLLKKMEYTEITELITGGPAWKSKELEPGDIILKVAQGDKEPEDIVGMRIDKAVKKIKGKKGTEVRLTIKKVDGTIKVVSLLRDTIETEETFARSTIIEKNGKKYGLLYLPKFYIDFVDFNERDAAKDVEIEIEKLKNNGVEGIVFDVRDNGGGSLKTVVEIMGLFIDKGPVVQVKPAGARKEVLEDKTGTVKWNGPLVVLVNQFSASASEILAAAVQDYNRGVVVGSKSTFGKGTVQSVIDLNQFVRSSTLGDLGALKLTGQKFFRIDGRSTQLNGVFSDVVLPNRLSYIDIGERDMDNAMEWSEISPANYKPLNNLFDRKTIVENSRSRIEKNDFFKMTDESAKWTKARRDETIISLNYNKYREYNKAMLDKSKAFDLLKDYKNNLTIYNLTEDQAKIDKDEALKIKRDAWFESIAKDAYIDESINVLQDLKYPSLASSQSSKINLENNKLKNK
jgi:carboxyl-terminal processing protease